MTRALIIDENVRQLIQAAMARAMDHVVPLETIMRAIKQTPQKTTELRLEDRPPGFERPESEHILIPVGFRASFSFEHQPAGLIKHLSISVDGPPGSTPHPLAVSMIAEEFGMLKGVTFNPDNSLTTAPDHKPFRLWLEEFEPGHQAVNVAELPFVGQRVSHHRRE